MVMISGKRRFAYESFSKNQWPQLWYFNYNRLKYAWKIIIGTLKTLHLQPCGYKKIINVIPVCIYK